MKKYLMKCGHISNATSDGKPCCAVCAGVTPAAFEVQAEADGAELLAGRKAVCPDCGREVDSSFNLPFFEYRPNKEKDSFYCGCYGWD